MREGTVPRRAHVVGGFLASPGTGVGAICSKVELRSKRVGTEVGWGYRRTR